MDSKHGHNTSDNSPGPGWRRARTAWAHHEPNDDAVVVKQGGDLGDATQDQLRKGTHIGMTTATTRTARYINVQQCNTPCCVLQACNSTYS
jgi:hypothetical protein